MNRINIMYFILPIVFVSFFCINANVTYFGDDYYFLSFQNYDLLSYFSKFGEHYLKDNGRMIVHFLDTIFLGLPIILWQLLNSAMLTGICYFATEIISDFFDNKNDKNLLIISILFVLIALLDISITRQSVYWITGSFNYVYPLFMFFLYWFYMLRFEKSKFNFAFTVIIGFLAATSVEQIGMMTVGLTTLILFSRIESLKGFKLKEFFKNNYKLIILFFVNILGIATVLLAPAQFIRINSGEEGSKIDMIIQNIKFLLNNYTSVKNILAYNILFNLVSICYALKNMKNVKLRNFIVVSCLVNILFTFICVFIIKSDVFYLFRCLMIGGILVTYATILIVINKNIFNKVISPLTISVILMIGSQVMMIVSPVVGYRNLLAGLMMFAFIIVIIVSRLKMNKGSLNTISAVLILFALISNLNTAKGYYQTRIIDKENMTIIEQSSGDRMITLRKFEDDNYGWSMPYISLYHEEKFKELYGISGDILWE